MKYFSAIVFIIIALFPGFSYAKAPLVPATLKNPVDISAASLEFDSEKNLYSAKGNVELREGTRALVADFMTYDERTKDVVAWGNVKFRDDEDTIDCERMTLNLDTKKGTIENGKIFIKKNEYYIAGEQIAKTGEQSYVIQKGEFTTCGWDKPTWKFAASNVEVTVDGYAVANKPSFYIKGHKVFQLPYGMFPVKTERQSGFLIPQILRSSKDGVVLKAAYYWAISQDKDATFYFDYLQKRGPKIGGEFRYALRDDFTGGWFGTILYDTKENTTRSQVKGYHQNTFWGDFVLKSYVNYASDYNYFRDFAYLKDFTQPKRSDLPFAEKETTFAEKNETLIKSNIFVEKPLPKSYFTIETAYFKNLVEQSNGKTFKYLPHITFFTEYIPIFQGLLYGNLSSSFLNLYRQSNYRSDVLAYNYGFNDLYSAAYVKDGKRFSRLRLEPSIKWPFSWNGVNLTVSGTLLETLYFTDASWGLGGDVKQKAIFKGEANLNTHLMRVYNTDFLGFGQIYSVIKPEIKYNYISNTSFRDVPPLDPVASLDKWGPYYTLDRIYSVNAITYSVSHYLSSSSRDISRFELSQTYGLSGRLKPSTLYADFGERFSDIRTRLSLYLLENLTFTHQSTFSTGSEGITSVYNLASYHLKDVFNITVGQTYSRGLSDQLLFGSWLRYKDFDFRYFTQYSFRDGAALESLYEVTYHPKCWAVTVGVTHSKKPRDTTVRLSVDLTGLSSGNF